MAEKEKKVHGSDVASCTCKSDFQDKEYGKGMRLMNRTNNGLRCTVCSSNKSR